METETSWKPLDIKKLLAQTGHFNTQYKKENGFSSSFFNPYNGAYGVQGNLRIADRSLYGDISCQTLRRVSKKAFIINICINHVLKKIKPFLKPATTENQRGFAIVKDGEAVKLDKKNAKTEEITKFLLNTGLKPDANRDNYQRFALKILRDVLEIDQVATEIGFMRNGKPNAFRAVDGATISRVIPGQDNPNNIEFVQTIDHVPQAFFNGSNLIFDYMNPRSDIEHPFYGYSYVDQVIDLITASINTFSYNAGFFVENKLPRGMILIDGNVSQETVEQMEDYLADVMSGGPSSQWKIPIIPAGGESENSQSIKWVPLGGTARDMEFQQWLDYQTSCIVAMFGCSMDELGLQSNKSQAIFENQGTAKISAAKSTILGDMLSFLQDYTTKIIKVFYPEYSLEFVGYEREDPKTLVDLAKEELGSYKTLNEVRKSKGEKELEFEWANIPLNPQAVQLYQAEKAQEQMGDGGMEGEFDDEDMAEEGLEDTSEEQPQEEDYGEVSEETEEDYGEPVELEKSIKLVRL